MYKGGGYMDNLDKITTNRLDTYGRLYDIEVEIITIAKQVQSGILEIGKLCFEGRELCKKQNINFENWCNNNIGLHVVNCRRFIRIYEVFQNDNLKEKYTEIYENTSNMSFRKLDALCMLAEPLVSNEDGIKRRNIVNSDGIRLFDVTKVEAFLNQYPEFNGMTLTKIREIINEQRDVERSLKEKEETLKELEEKIRDFEENNDKYAQLEAIKYKEKALLEIEKNKKQVEYDLEIRRKEIIEHIKKNEKEKRDLEEEREKIISMGAKVKTQERLLKDVENKLVKTKEEILNLTKDKECLYKQLDNMKEINNFVAIARKFQKEFSAFESNSNIMKLLGEPKIYDNVIGVLNDIDNTLLHIRNRFKDYQNIIQVEVR